LIDDKRRSSKTVREQIIILGSVLVTSVEGVADSISVLRFFLKVLVLFLLQVVDLAGLSDDKVFYFYQDPVSPGSDYTMDCMQKVITVEDQLLTATEVLARNSFGKRHIR
jgi:hypothetical protein